MNPQEWYKNEKEKKEQKECNHSYAWTPHAVMHLYKKYTCVKCHHSVDEVPSNKT